MFMKRKLFALSAVMIGLVMGASGVVNNNKQSQTVKNTEKDTRTENETIWREVKIEEGKYIAKASMKDYDLKKIVGEADYVFSGTIIDRHEYEVEWTDEKGEKRGPFSKSVVEVKISKEYHGESPVSGDSIRVYYPYSLSVDFEGTFSMEEDKEYIFVTKALDEEFVERRKRETPDSGYEQERYADVYISDTCYNILPVEDGEVYMYHDYFYWNDEVMEQTISGEAIVADDVVEPELIDSGWFIALEEQDFEKAFFELFENVEVLPDANELIEIHERKSESEEDLDFELNLNQKNSSDKSSIQPEEYKGIRKLF